MKKVLLVVALLLLATPVFAADVTVTANLGTVINAGEPNLRYPVRVGFTGAAEANTIRAFALVLTVDSGANLDNIRDYNRGESTKVGGGFGIFPGKVRDIVNPTTPDACFARPDYNPIAPAGDPNGAGGLDNPRMVVELGTLYKDANVPGAAGTLFTVDVNLENNSGSKECNLCIAVDQTRGGVVKKDATAATVTLPSCIKITYSSGCTVPNLVGLTRVAARNAITAAGFPVGVEANVAPTAAGQAVASVIAQKQTAGAVLPCSTPIDFNTVNYPIKYMSAANSLYANWVLRSKPQCWAYPRQCHADADGKKLGTLWVSGNDLTILKSAISKAETAIPTGGICADFDHKKLGTLWVSGNDLTILKAYISKAETAVPICGTIPTALAGFSADPNYWYFCIPTGVTCPTGQYCAPAGVCPNTP